MGPLSPLGGILAGCLLFFVAALGVATGRMPLRGANNLGIEVDRWPIVFWLYTAAIAGLGVAAFVWGLRGWLRQRREAPSR